MTLVKGQQYTPEQIYKEDPEWLKQNDPNLYSKFVTQVSQPEVQLQGEQLGNTGRTIANTKANAILLPEIKSTVAQSNITQQEADKQKAFNDTQAMFTNSGAQDKNGKVSPQAYNKALENVSKYMTSDEFNSRFKEPFSNPNNIAYNTPENIAVRKTLPNIANIVRSYYGLTKNGPGWDALTKIPLLGDYFKKVSFNDEIAHDSLLKGTSAELLKLAGAGSGSTIRGSMPELAQVQGLLPSASDATETAGKKLDKLDSFMQKTYGVSLKELLK